ncbi:MAG: 50S ribosomal protein L17 [Chloroflexia bacterium]|nr:50S ribosomal protein L17 [Chloroflexia bacterium]
MRHRKSGRKLNRNSGQRRALYRSLMASLLWHGKIVTTEAKAKALRPHVERMITLAKEDTAHRRSLAMAKLPNDRVVERLFTEVAPEYQDRPGGYTRIIRIGPRQGDAAMMVQIELV